MGTISHHSIIVTGDEEEVKKAISKAKTIFKKHFKKKNTFEDGSHLISDLIQATNRYVSFFIAPDGSKDGWETSNAGDDARAEFMEYLTSDAEYLDYILVEFGGDHNKNRIIYAND